MTSLIFFGLAVPIIVLIAACNRALKEQFAISGSSRDDGSLQA